jgi:DNA replication protein DnaC
LTRRGLGSINTILDGTTTVTDFAEHSTEDKVELAARRLEQCARCPSYGGACDSSYEHLPPGEQPSWMTTNGFAFERCDRWTPYLYRKLAAQYGVPIAMLGKTIDEYEPANESMVMALKICQVFVKRFGSEQRKTSIALIGPTGVGKTHLAAAALQELLQTQRIREPLFAYVPKFIEDVRSSFDAPREEREAFMARAIGSDLLVLDDLGAERVTDWVRERIGVIINERWANARPVIITTNADLDHFAETLGDRAISRLKAMCVGVSLAGEDRR